MAKKLILLMLIITLTIKVNFVTLPAGWLLLRLQLQVAAGFC